MTIFKISLPAIFLSLACAICQPATTYAQVITTIAGTGTAGFTGDGGPALNAQLNTPLGLCLDAVGNIYFADYKNQRIRKISKATGLISTIAGNGNTGFSGDGGPALNASMNEPMRLCFDNTRNYLYFSDYWNLRVRRIDLTTGIINTIAGDGTENYVNGGLAKNSGLLPGGIALDAAGNLFVAQHPGPFASYTTNIISRIDIGSGIITTVAGNGQFTFAGDGGPALSASFFVPMDVAVDGGGNLYVADCMNQRIRKIDKVTGIISTIAGDGKNTFPSPDGGQASSTSLKNPVGVSMSNNGNLIIVDQADLKVRLLNLTSGILTTLAGNSYLGHGPDCVEATTETLADLASAVMDAAGNLYFNDQLYHRIRMVFAANAIPSVNISADAKSICAGTPVTFSTTVTNGSPDDTYQWMINGIATGATGTAYPTNSLKNNDQVICRLQYAPYTTCPDQSAVNSNPITIIVNPPVTPAISIAATAADICSGSTATFTATASNGGGVPEYQWLVNGSASGNNSNSFTSNQLADQDEVSCILRADPDQGCLASANAVSNAIRMKVNTFPAPSVIISGGEQKICPEDSITFAAVPKDAGPDPLYQWQMNGIGVGEPGPVFTVHDLKEGDQVSCLMLAKNAACAAGIPAQSNIEHISLYPSPAITFSNTDTLIQPGQQIQLHALLGADIQSYQWSPAGKLADPFTPDPLSIPLESNTVFQLTAVSDKGCIAGKSISVKIFFKLNMPNAFTPNHDGKNDLFRIPQNTTMTLHEFSIFDRWGNKIFSTADISRGWDGFYGGLPSEEGVYIYLISGESLNGKMFSKGTFVLLR